MFLLTIGSFLALGLTTAIPFVVFFIVLLIGNGEGKSLGIARAILLLTFLGVLVLVLSLTVSSSSAEGYALDIRLNYVPFAEVTSNTLQYVLNILLFVPLGFLLPLLWEAFEKPSHAVLAGALFSLSIEIAQLFSHRVTDIDDLMMNTLGVAVGWVAFVSARRIAPEATVFVRGPRTASPVREAVLCFALAWIAVLTVYPFLADFFLATTIS